MYLSISLISRYIHGIPTMNITGQEEREPHIETAVIAEQKLPTCLFSNAFMIINNLLFQFMTLQVFLLGKLF